MGNPGLIAVTIATLAVVRAADRLCRWDEPVDRILHRRGQLSARERLLHELRPVPLNRLDRLIAVAGDEDDGRRRATLRKVRDQLTPRHAGHRQVADQRLEGAMRIPHPKRRVGRGDSGDGEAHILEHFRGELADDCLILDEEDACPLGRRPEVGRGVVVGLGDLLGLREVQLEYRALPYLGDDVDVTAGLLDSTALIMVGKPLAGDPRFG